MGKRLGGNFTSLYYVLNNLHALFLTRWWVAIVTILQMSKARLREAKELVQGLPASK